MITFTWIVLGVVAFTFLGWIAAALLWLKNADLKDEVYDYRERLKEAHSDLVRLKYDHARERLQALVASSPKVVPIRSTKP